MRLRGLLALSPALLITQCAPECAPQAPAGVHWQAGNCASFAEEAAAAGLPWGIFSKIAWRESGCNPNAWVVDNDDTGGGLNQYSGVADYVGGGLFGFNFRGSLASHWRNLCGMTPSNMRGNVPLQMKCAAAQYHQYGMGAWST